ncbi:MAG: hypothetical protein LBK47_01065 [Prevotellaceae bacterium]|jgi:hypothetical protein|nr:hypothetical protein [Prevotellaceae bacterium]
MKKTITILGLVLGVAWNTLFAQTKQEQFQGIWRNVPHIETQEQLFKIINGINGLAISHLNEDNLDFYLNENIEGFVDTNSFDVITLDSLHTNGKYYLFISKKNVKNGRINRIECVIGSDLYFEDDNLIIEGGRLSEYTHLERLPSLTLRLLYKRGKKDNRNYLKEYLNIDVTEVVSSKSPIYAEPDKPTKMYLIKGDIVTVLEEKDGWLRIEYEGKKMITGWIKKEDIRE